MLRLSRLMMWGMILLIVGPCAFRQAPLEVARWHVAQAIDLREAGRNEAAMQSLDRALAWDAENPAIFLRRARWLKAEGQYEAALAEILKADLLMPDNFAILSQRADALQLLGRYAEAVEIWKAIDRQSIAGGNPPRAMAQNGLAYARAVGNLELDEALAGINQALESDPANAAMLDTRGFILYRQGKFKEAAADMEPAVRQAEGDIQLAERRPATELRTIHFSEYSDDLLARVRRDAAILRYHRALVYEKLGRHAAAKLDRSRAKVLIGREPDEKLF
jgi:tetratricopeptide (TPR) repeat protein